MTGGPAGRFSPVERSVLAWLLVMPLLERRELTHLAEWSLKAVEQALRHLESQHLVAGVPVLLPDIPPHRRFHLTGEGVSAIARLRDTSTAVLLERHPVSAHYLHLLLFRMETLALVYRATTLLADFEGVRGFRWMRKHPLDAVIAFEDGRRLGVIREGPAAPPAHFGGRLWSLHRSPRPDTLLVIAPDHARLRDFRRALDASHLTTFLTVQSDLLSADRESPIWRVPSDPEPWPLRRIYPLIRRGTVPNEPPPANVTAPPGDLAPAARRWLASEGQADDTDRFLPLVLPSGAKRAMTELHRWPWIAMPDLQALLGLTKDGLLRALDLPMRLGLVQKFRHQGRFRYVLSDRGLRLLARSNRLAVPTMHRRWSPSLRDPGEPLSWRNVKGTRMRQLLRDVAHTTAVHRFVAGMASQVKARGGCVLLMEPAHRASRRFTVDGRHAAINPDAYGVIELGGEPVHFFLEWERRAEHPAQLRGKLLPYLRYYRTSSLLNDDGEVPALLFVLRDEIAAMHFLRIAREELGHPSPPAMHVLVSHAALVDSEGPLGKVWRTPSLPSDVLRAYMPRPDRR